MSFVDTTEFILTSFVLLIVLGALATLGGIAAHIANETAIAIGALVIFVLGLPSLGIFLWILSKLKEF